MKASYEESSLWFTFKEQQEHKTTNNAIVTASSACSAATQDHEAVMERRSRLACERIHQKAGCCYCACW